MSRTLFHLTTVATTAFVITILAMVAMMLGEPNAPINVWFDRHGAAVLACEVLAIVVFGLVAMMADRWETLREQAAAAGTSSPPNTNEQIGG